MAVETIAANKSQESIIVGGAKERQNDFIRFLTINGTDISAGLMVTQSGETAPDVDLVAGGEPLAGVVLDYAVEADKKASYSLGVTIGDDKLAKVMFRTGGEMVIQCVLNRSATVSAALAIGEPIFLSVTDAGKVSHIKPTTANIEALRFVGYSEDAVGVAVTADKVIRVRY